MSLTHGNMPSSGPLSFNSGSITYTGAAKAFTLNDLEKATNNFDSSRILGEGGFGLVYKGVLNDGRDVAVKILKRDDQRGGREFLAEVEMLSRLHHRNLVKLIGICIEKKTRCLVYELVPNGSVESHLHGKQNQNRSSRISSNSFGIQKDMISIQILTFECSLFSQVLTRKLVH